MGALFIPGIATANDKHGTTTRRPSDWTEKTGRSDQRTTSTKAAARTFEEVKSRCLKGIAGRQARLDRLGAKVGQTVDEHDLALLAIVTTSPKWAISLKATIEANTGDLAKHRGGLPADRHRSADLRVARPADRLGDVDRQGRRGDGETRGLARRVGGHDRGGRPSEHPGGPDAGGGRGVVDEARSRARPVPRRRSTVSMPSGYSAISSSRRLQRLTGRCCICTCQWVRSARSDLRKASQFGRREHRRSFSNRGRRPRNTTTDQ